MRYLILLSVFACLTACQQRTYPSGSEPKNIIIPSEMNVTKLMMNGQDRSEQLGRVRLTEKQWSEYDSDGNVIGVADIVTVNNRTIEVKWTMAENGAEVGENTFYDYHILTDKVIFTIWQRNVQKGYFEAKLDKRE